MAAEKGNGKKGSASTGASPAEPKVKGYPFKASLEVGAVKRPIDIVYVGVKGFIARLGPQFVHVGDRFTVVFEVPLVEKFVNTPVRVQKTYDKAQDNKATKVDRMAEFHFEKLDDDHRARITQFMIAIGQAK
jgi:hypothetical protein